MVNKKNPELYIDSLPMGSTFVMPAVVSDLDRPFRRNDPLRSSAASASPPSMKACSPLHNCLLASPSMLRLFSVPSWVNFFFLRKKENKLFLFVFYIVQLWEIRTWSKPSPSWLALPSCRWNSAVLTNMLVEPPSMTSDRRSADLRAADFPVSRRSPISPFRSKLEQMF